MSSFEKILEYQPCDPIEFLYRENFITLSSIGSIFTFALIGNFRENVFDRIMTYVLPLESFEFMQVELPDIGTNKVMKTPDPYNANEFIDVKEPYTIKFGGFIREAIIWIFMILLLYILAIGIRYPISGGFSWNTVKTVQ